MCSARAIKYLVIFFNFIFLVLGILFIGVGAWAEVKYGDFVEVTSVDYATASRLVIAVGVIITITALFGFCGAIGQNKICLIIFFVILLILLILEITGAALGYVNRDKVKNNIQKDLVDAVHNKYGKSDQSGTTKAVDMLQEKEKCCGIQNYTNWYRSEFSKGHNLKLPDSCCRDQTTNCANPLKKLEDIYPKGCYEKMLDTVQDKLYIIGSICIALIVFQVLGMIFAVILICNIHEETKMIA